MPNRIQRALKRVTSLRRKKKDGLRRVGEAVTGALEEAIELLVESSSACPPLQSVMSSIQHILRIIKVRYLTNPITLIPTKIYIKLGG